MADTVATPANIENVLIRAGACSVAVLPQFGGKISSIRVGEQELLQQPLAPLASRTRSMTFDAGDASGWDECLPSVAGCRVNTESGQAEIPDHGDLWRVEWEQQESRISIQGVEGKPDSSITLIGKCFSLPLEIKRKLELVQSGKCWDLKIQYTLSNRSSSAVPWSWAAHPLFSVQEGDRIVLPGSVNALRLEGSGGGRLGKGGDIIAWPIAKLSDGSSADLSIADATDSGIADKLFAGPLTAAENWCALERMTAGLRIRVNFDPIATPYLGMWICYGGWPERPGPKQVCVALEPATAPVDSLAITGPWSRSLAGGESFSWKMNIEISTIER